jgi:hypothetical protein
MDIQVAMRARECFDAYRTLEYAKFGGAHDALYQEIVKRLRQLRWITEEVISLCQYSFNQQRSMFQTGALTSDANLRNFGVAQLEIHDRIELHTESFYWVAHRTATVIRLMPGLKSFNAVGVRDVRNWLLEHTGPSGSPNVGFGWGSGAGLDGVLSGGNGPTIATLADGDKGLYCNATEFFVEVQRVARRCVEQPELIASKPARSTRPK